MHTIYYLFKGEYIIIQLKMVFGEQVAAGGGCKEVKTPPKKKKPLKKVKVFFLVFCLENFWNILSRKLVQSEGIS